MRPAHAIFLALLLAGCAVVSKNTSGNPDSTRSVSLDAACPVLAGMPGTKTSCYIDSFGLISKPRDYCGARVISFGFIAKTWGVLAIYPDEARANAQFIFSAVSLGDNLGHEQLVGLVDTTGGFYAEVTGRFDCNVKNDASEFGVGTIELEKVSVFDARLGDAAKERVFFKAPAAVQDQ